MFKGFVISLVPTTNDLCEHSAIVPVSWLYKCRKKTYILLIRFMSYNNLDVVFLQFGLLLRRITTEVNIVSMWEVTQHSSEINKKILRNSEKNVISDICFSLMIK